jgi:hypothetical protein
MKTYFSFKIAGLTVFFMIGIGLLSCDIFDPCDCSPVEEFFDITDMISENYQDPEEGLREILQPGDTVAWQEFRIVNTFVVDYYGAAFPESQPGPAWNQGWMPMAIGCDCPWPGIRGSDEGLKSMTVQLASPSLNGVQPQDTINQLLQVVYFNGTTESIEDFVANNSSTILSEEFMLAFRETPETVAPFNAQITVELGNGEIYSTITPEVVVE